MQPSLCCGRRCGTYVVRLHRGRNQIRKNRIWEVQGRIGPLQSQGCHVIRSCSHLRHLELVEPNAHGFTRLAYFGYPFPASAPSPTIFWVLSRTGRSRFIFWVWVFDFLGLGICSGFDFFGNWFSGLWADEGCKVLLSLDMVISGRRCEKGIHWAWLWCKTDLGKEMSGS